MLAGVANSRAVLFGSELQASVAGLVQEGHLKALGLYSWTIPGMACSRVC